jgi:hypothetical protein
MNYFFLLILTITTLSADIISFNNYLYSFSENGKPISRITKEGNIQVPFQNTFVDLIFKETVKHDILNDNEFKKLDKQTKIKYISKYFETEIKPKIINLPENELTRHLEILKIKILNQ